MKIKRLLLLTAFCAWAFVAGAQELMVESFEHLPFCNDAKTITAKRDQNGKRCALIKVETVDKDVTFDGGVLDMVEVERKSGEYWVWLPANSRKITISHPDCTPIRDYDFDGYTLQEGNAYLLKLITPKKAETIIQQVQQQVQQSIQIIKCTLSVKSDRLGDMVFINDSLVGKTSLEIKLNPGTYAVKVKRGEIEETQMVDVKSGDALKSLEFKFARTVDIKTDRNGDMVYVDNQRMGYSPVRAELEYGTHTVEAKRPDGKYQIQDIVVERDGDNPDYYLHLYSEQQHFTHESISFATLNVAVGLYDISNHQSYMQKSYGFTVGSVEKIGWYFSAMSNFQFKAMGADYIADYTPYFDGNGNEQYGDFVDGNYPYYTEESCSSRLSIMAGLLLKMGDRTCFRVGAGYGRRVYAFQESGGNWVRPSRFDKNGFDLALGMQFNNASRTSFSIDVVSTNLSTVEVKLGLGVCLQTKKLFINE